MSEEDIDAWTALWKDPKDFTGWGHPAKATEALQEPLQAWLTRYPTLNQATVLYGAPAVRLFVGAQLGAYLSQNSSVSNQMTDEQLQGMCQDIIAVMRNYTVSEIRLFFALLRTGMWKTYGITTQEICDKFRHEFNDYRNNKIDEANALQAQKNREARIDRCVTYEEYCQHMLQLKKQQNQNPKTTKTQKSCTTKSKQK